ncbi:hypothetical protein AAC387_Pa07g3497 [Persea americana]
MRMCGLSYAQIGGKAANAGLPSLKTAEKLQVQDFLTRRAGKPPGAALPPLETAEKLRVQVFLHSQRRKTCRSSFTAASNGGKAAGAGFPALRVVGNLQVRVCLSLSGDKAVA